MVELIKRTRMSIESDFPLSDESTDWEFYDNQITLKREATMKVQKNATRMTRAFTTVML